MDLNFKRVCIIGSPRSGSQYVSELIRLSVMRASGKAVYNLAEPFTDNQLYQLVLDKDNYLKNQNINKLPPIEERIENTISVLKNANLNQQIVIKLFPYKYLVPHLTKILDTLYNADFVFLILRRKNVEDQLLSFAVAETTNSWTGINGEGILNSEITISPETLKKLKITHKYLDYFEYILNKFTLKHLPNIYYETAVEDLYDLLQIPINTREMTLQKQIPSDPYQFITNAEEVKQFIETLIDGNQLHKT